MTNTKINIKSIKLIIWDLDDTLWIGTLSEGEVNMPFTHIDLIKNICDAGVINSICSKNDETEVITKLNSLKISDYFVFNSINWNNKGERIHQTISDMSLRNVNVLFIDDNLTNLKEVEFYNPGINISTPEIIPSLIKYFKSCPKTDSEHKRLGQYKVLENKKVESLNYNSNEEFLHNCNITLQINRDCQNKIDRLYELSLRTNQLNFTKRRISFDEFQRAISNLDCGYITVQDRFGDYGIVGFYAINTLNELEHFYFSCRTIGQGIEQYIYSILGFPQLDIKGDVAVVLDKHTKPSWIKEKEYSGIKYEQQSLIHENSQFLFKGPCDMSSMIGYLQINTGVTTEFTFIDNLGHSIENHNHSAHIYGLKTFTQEQFNFLKSECFFIDKENFESDIFKHNYRIIFLSTLIEGQYGLYRRKESGEIVAFGHYDYPLTDRNNWEKYINNSVPTYNYRITKNDLELFASKYEYIGRTTPDMYITFLKFLLSSINPDTTICLILGSEIAYNNETETTYYDRAVYHSQLNKRIKALVQENQRLRYIELTKYIKDQNDFTNNINHFKPKVYYSFAKDVLSIIAKVEGVSNMVKCNYKQFFYKKYIQPVRLKIPQPIIDTLKYLIKFSH